MQKVNYFKNLLWVLLIFVALLITFQACERDSILLEPVNKQNIKTVTKADAFYHLQNKTTLNRSGTSFVTEIDDAVVYDSLINSDEMLATIAVQTQFVNANSRILMIEINDTIQTAVYNMFSKNNFETDTFYGDVLITDLDGNILNALKVEDDYYVAQYLLPENFSVSSNVYSRSSGCPECPEFADCNMCGELGEVVLNSTKKIKVTYIYCHFCTLSQGDQPENESIEAAEWGGGGGNPSACPTGYIRDDNNNCVPIIPYNPCDELFNLNTSTDYQNIVNILKGKFNDLVESGYSLDINGNYVPMVVSSNGTSLAGFGPNVLFSDVVGIVHMHQNDIIIGTTIYGQNQIRSHIKMFSPLDLHTFLFMALNAQNNSQINIKDVFSTMVASNGVYTLKFVGNNQTFINTAFNPYSEDLENDFKKFVRDYGLERGFLKFLEALNLNNIVALFKTENNGVVKEIKLTENGKKRSLPCE